MNTIRITVPLVYGCCGLLRLTAFGDEAITSYHLADMRISGFVHAGAGFAFSPKVDIVATALGWGDGAALTNEPVTTIMWDTNGMPLRAVVLTTNSPGFNQAQYEPILPAPLSAGVTYYLSSCGTTSGVWFGYPIFSNLPNGDFTVAPELDYLGAAGMTNAAGAFPEEVFLGQNLFLGANFQFVRAPLIVLGGLRIQNAEVRLELTVTGGSPTTFTLLEAGHLGGPWLTNRDTSVVTNVAGTSYTLKTLALGNVRLYRVQSP